jgi:hypothetical protein
MHILSGRIINFPVPRQNPAHGLSCCFTLDSREHVWVARSAFTVCARAGRWWPEAGWEGVLSEDFPMLAGFRAGSLVAGYRLEAQVGAAGMRDQGRVARGDRRIGLPE